MDGYVSMRLLSLTTIYCLLAFISARASAGDEDSDPVVMAKKRSEWIQQLKDEYLENRIRAIVLLGSLGKDSESATSALAACLKDDNKNVRQRANQALLEIGKFEDNAKFADAVLPVLTDILKNAGIGTKLEIIELIGGVGRRAKSLAPELVSLIKDNGKSARRLVDAIKEIQADASIAGGAVELLDCPDDDIGISALALLKFIGHDWNSEIDLYFVAKNAELNSPSCKTSVEALCKKMAEELSSDRAISAALLGKLGKRAESAIPSLTKALNDEDDYVRKQAAKSLKTIEESLKQKEKEKTP
jgi:hypothetical protein